MYGNLRDLKIEWDQFTASGPHTNADMVAKILTLWPCAMHAVANLVNASSDEERKEEMLRTRVVLTPLLHQLLDVYVKPIHESGVIMALPYGRSCTEAERRALAQWWATRSSRETAE